jgi:hypothetical protein
MLSLLLLCLLTGAVNAQTCTPLQSVQATLDGAQNFCRTSTGGTFTATESAGGTSAHQWVYGVSSNGPWTPIPGATGATYQLNGSDFPSTGVWWIAVTSTPQCGSPMTSTAQPANVYDTLPAPQFDGNSQICSNATNAIALAAAQWDSYQWSITRATLIPGANGCGDDPTKRCISYRPDGTGDVHLSLTVTAGSCSSNALHAVPLVENPPPSLSVIGPLCAGSQGSATTSQYPAGVRTWSVRNAHLDSDWGDHIFFTPDGNGPVDVAVTVTDTNGCASSSMTRVPLAATKPAIMLGRPGCANQTSAAATGGWDSYVWSITNGTIVSGQGTPNISFAGSSPGTPMVLSVTGRANSGTFSCTTASDSVTVPSVTTPAITLGTPTICPYGTDTATAPAGYANYWWALSNGYVMSGDGTNSIRFSRGGGMPGNTDPIVITLYVADATGCSGGPATATVPTRTIPPPAITLGTADICPYGTDTATVPPQYANYWWTLSNGYVMSGDGTNSIRFSRGGGAPGNTDPITITLYVQDADGCPAGPVTITVPTRIIAAPVITLGTSDICPYGTDTATAPTGYANYWWALSNGYVMSGDGTNSIRFSRGGGAPGSTEPITITLYVQDANGCPAGPTSITVPTRVIPAPVITLGTPDICKYGTNTASVPAQYANYWWSISNGYLMSGDGTNAITFSPGGGMPGSEQGPITITLYVQDVNGCPAPQSTVTVPVRAIPPPTITLATPDVCKSGSDTASVPAQYANYSWSITGGFITGGSITSNSITFTPDPMNPVPISLSLYVQDGNGCPALVSDVVVPIRAIAPPVITASGSTSLCANGSVTLTAPAGFSYLWSNGATTRAITVTQAGDYFVIVNDTSGCSAFSTPVHVTVATPSVLAVTTQYGTSCPYGQVLAAVSNPSLFTNITWSAVGGGVYPNGALCAISVYGGVNQVSITASATDLATGCPVSSIVVIPVAPLAPPPMTVSSDGPICYGSAVTISIPPQPAGSEIIWDYTGVKLGGGNGQTFITLSAPPGPSFSLRVRLSDPGWCSTENTITVPVHLPVVPLLQADDRAGCAYAVKTVTVTNPTAYTSYSWSVTNGTIIGPNDQPTVHIGLLGAGTNTNVTFTASDGTCPVTGSAGFFATQPTAAISVSGAPYCAGRNAMLFANTDGFFHPTYLWSNGATTSSITVAPDAPGPYTVTVTNEYGCSTTSAPVTVPLEPTDTRITATGPTTFCAGGHVFLAPIMPGQSYLWSNGATTQTIDVTQSGDYSVTVNTGLCSYAAPAVDVTVNPLPAAAITASGPTTLCPGGSVTLTASAASSYAWSNGATTQSITVSAAGSYSVTVTNANGCSAASAPTTVAVNAPPSVTITAGGPTTFCTGGSVTLTASAGASYLWSTGATTPTIGAAATGNYTVTVTDANGCSATSAPTAVTANPLPATTITPSGPTRFCTGGSVTLTAPGGVSYLWSTGETTSSIVASTSGDYTVRTTNGNGCTSTSAPATVTVNSLPAAAITAGGTTTFCPGGSVTLTASSGASYLWSTGATTSSIAATTSGNYTVTVTNANGCGTTSAPIAVTTNPTPAAIISAGGPTTFCAGGNVRLTTSGGASYLWSTGATTSSIIVSTSDSYTVTVTNGYGCSATSAPLVVTANAAPPATITAGGPTTFCAGGNVALTASSGASYLWSTGATTPSIIATTTGTYVVTVTYGNGCRATSTPFAVTANAIPPANITASGPTTFCAPGSVTLTASSAASYLWSTGETTRSIVTSSSGNYTVTTSANGCSATSAPTAVTVNPPAVASITASGPTTFCAGGNVTLTASNGASYLWSTGATTQSIVANTSNNYSVTVTNANGCSATSTATLVTVNANPAASITVYGSTTFCAGGNVTLAAPSPASSYLWSTGATTQSILATSAGNYTVTVTNASGCSTTSAPVTVTVNPAPVATITASGPTTFCDGGNVTLTASSGASYMWSTGATTQSIAATYASSYTVTVTDAIGCSATSAPTRVSVIANLAPTISVSAPTTFCAGGGVALSATDGYDSYLWSTGATTSAIIVTSSGSYTVAATRNGCAATSAAVVVTVNANPPAPAISAGGPTTFCAGGSVTLTAPAGFAYSWSNGSTTQSIVASTSGNYTLTVTDAHGCSATSAASPVTVNALPVPSIDIQGPLTYCDSPQSTQLNASPPTGTWYRNGVAATTTPGISMRDFGTGTNTFVWRATNAAGCTKDSDPVVVTVKPAPNSGANFGFLCWNGQSDAQSLETSPGTTYQWSVTNGTILSGNGTSKIVYAAAAGATTVGVDWTVTTASGCAATNHFDVAVDVLQTTASAAGPTTFCAGGSVVLTAATVPGAGYYQWSNGAQGQSITVTAGGTYSVHAIRATNGCVGKESNPVSVTIQTPSSPTITAGGPTTFCAGGSVTLTASAGSSYLWSTGAATQSIAVNTGGSYSVTVTNGFGCSATSAATPVTVNLTPTPDITPSGAMTFCTGGSVTLTAPAGYTYTWSNAATTRSITVSASGNYSVTVRDANGCSGTSAVVTVTVSPRPTATVSGGGTICPAASSTITAMLTGTAPWSVTWSDNVTQTINSGTTATRTVSPSATTNYTVTALTDATCTGTSSGTAIVTVKAVPTASVSGGGAICPSASSTITATLTGTAPFTVIWSDNVTQTINSGTTATRTVSPAATTTYTVTSVSDAQSCPRPGTGSATVTRNTAASITTQPVNKTTTRNTSVTLSVAAAGSTPISYQWFKGTGSSIAGATSSSYTTSFSGKGTNTFYVEVWNACNTTHVKSSTVTVTVN